MVRAEAETRIARPVATVFAFVVEGFFENYPRWSPEVETLEALTGVGLAVGTAARQVRVDHGRRTETTFEVIELVRDRRAVFAGTSQPFRAIYEFEPAADGTVLRFAFELTRIRPAWRPFARLIRTAVARGVRDVPGNIRVLVETETPPLAGAPGGRAPL
jgi:hypothetical protein